jgi:UDP:flavonoid glycosyltransferase YjiC (YdhE family)
VQPGSKREVDALIRSQYNNAHPTYFRLSDHSHAIDTDLGFGKGTVLKNEGAPLTVMTAGPILTNVMEACRDLPVNLVVTTGPDFDPELIGPLPGSVRTAPFLPQAALLPLCTAVVSHAGAGTMLGALCHGLPQLCLPQGTDQPSNTAALLPTGAAVALHPDETTADAVAAAMTRLLGETSFREAAERLRREIEAMPTADDVLDELLATVG